MKPPVLLTGATGFLGTEVLARLVERDDREVVCLVRAPDEPTARERIDAVLARLWDDPSDQRERIRPLAGDLTQEGFGVPAPLRAELAEEIGGVIHCAAAIAFDMPLVAARSINVEGTREMLGFARQARMLGRLDRFVHVSTAYVSGRHSGAFAESELDVGQEFRNTYERTKWEAEHVVAAADDLAPVIARPSIVMGEAASGWTPAFNVLYWPLKAFARGLFDSIPAFGHAPVDVVPVDYVADALVHLYETGDPGVVNLVAGSAALDVDAIVGLASAYFSRERPAVVDPGSAGSSATADERGDVYVPYFGMEIAFDDVRARAALEPAGIRCPPLRDYFATLMSYAEATDWGKFPLTREAARRLAHVQ